MTEEKLMDQRTALLKIPAESIDSLLVPVFDPRAQKAARVIGRGLPAGPGAASGLIVFTANAAELESKRGNRVVLCRMETSPDDLKGMLYSQGILTSRGGVSSHAALVARQLGKVCVCGATNIVINYEKKTLTADGVVLKEGDYISLDGSTGEIYAGPIDSADSEVKRVLSGSLKPAQELHIPPVRNGDGVGRQASKACDQNECRHAGNGAAGGDVRRRGHRTVPDRAHVLRRRPHRLHAPDDPCGR